MEGHTFSKEAVHGVSMMLKVKVKGDTPNQCKPNGLGCLMTLTRPSYGRETGSHISSK